MGVPFKKAKVAGRLLRFFLFYHLEIEKTKNKSWICIARLIYKAFIEMIMQAQPREQHQ